MIEEFTILTGASRGLGAALARRLLRPGTQLVTLARQPHPELSRQAVQAGAVLTQVQSDLSDARQAQEAAERLANLIPRDARRYRLINNAGTVQPIAPAMDLHDGIAIQQAFTLNVTAVMLLTASFLRSVQELQADRRVLNISSGAGRSPVQGWSVYCATKAALDMATRVLSQEQRSHGIRVASLAPGLIDTDMQTDIRASDPTQLPSVAKFKDYKDNGSLVAPEVTAARILAYLDRPDFGQSELDDIRHYA